MRNTSDATVTLPPTLLSSEGCKTPKSIAILQKAKERTSPETFQRLLSLFCDTIQKIPSLDFSSITLDELVNTQLQESGLSSVDLVNLKESICTAMNIYLAGTFVEILRCVSVLCFLIQDECRLFDFFFFHILTLFVASAFLTLSSIGDFIDIVLDNISDNLMKKKKKAPRKAPVTASPKSKDRPSDVNKSPKEIFDILNDLIRNRIGFDVRLSDNPIDIEKKMNEFGLSEVELMDVKESLSAALELLIPGGIGWIRMTSLGAFVAMVSRQAFGSLNNYPKVMPIVKELPVTQPAKDSPVVTPSSLISPAVTPLSAFQSPSSANLAFSSHVTMQLSDPNQKPPEKEAISLFDALGVAEPTRIRPMGSFSLLDRPDPVTPPANSTRKAARPISMMSTATLIVQQTKKPSPPPSQQTTEPSPVSSRYSPQSLKRTRPQTTKLSAVSLDDRQSDPVLSVHTSIPRGSHQLSRENPSVTPTQRSSPSIIRPVVGKGDESPSRTDILSSEPPLSPTSTPLSPPSSPKRSLMSLNEHMSFIAQTQREGSSTSIRKQLATKKQ
jgi:hypothetical protein